MGRTIFLTFILFTLLFNSCKGQGSNQVQVNKTETKKGVTNEEVKVLYNKKINPQKVTYKKYEKNINGAEEWYCDLNYLRYLPVLKKEKFELILVPQDCGDFNYRYYLLNIIDGSIVSSLYVEGEWVESGTIKEEFYELTSFSINSDNLIIIRKEFFENLKKTDVEITNYGISSKGEFIEVK